jgi:Ca-activated chloride channel family protein
VVSFAHPLALLLLLTVPPLLWHWRSRSRGGWQVSDTRPLDFPASPRVRWARRGGLWLRGAGLVLLVVALAGPRWPDLRSRVPVDGIAIAMVLDVSGSMAEQDFPWDGGKISRLDGVKRVFRRFVAGEADAGLPGRRSDLIALVVFATHPETVCPLTLDHAALLKILETQQARVSALEATTNPGDAILWGLNLLNQAPVKRKVLVFLTDGESNVPGKLKPRQAAQIAANLGIAIHAIDASPEPGDKESPGDIVRARETMKALATMTKGECFRARDGEGLARAYERIDQLERSAIESFQYRRWREGWLPFALLGLGCWSVLLVLESTRWRTLP